MSHGVLGSNHTWLTHSTSKPKMENLTEADFVGRTLFIWSHKCFVITSLEMLNQNRGSIKKILKMEWLGHLCKGTTKRGTPCMKGVKRGSLFCKHHTLNSYVKCDVLEEDECPVCLDDYIPTIKSLCGHHACQSCCKSMKESGRTICCPLCRDSRFKAICG